MLPGCSLPRWGLSMIDSPVMRFKPRLHRSASPWMLAAIAQLPLWGFNHPGYSEVPGFAEITSPRADQAVAGVVTIAGTADHPAFQRFEVAFGYDPDPTETWFPIGEPISTPVIDGRLALWDTMRISDGTYRLRLQVWLEDGQMLEAIVSGVRVRNYSPTETAESAAAGQTISIPPTPTATLVAAPTPSPDLTASSGNPFSLSFALGAVGAMAAFGVLAVYRRLGASIRDHIAYLRIRQVHRRLDRPQRRSGRR